MDPPTEQISENPSGVGTGPDGSKGLIHSTSNAGHSRLLVKPPNSKDSKEGQNILAMTVEAAIRDAARVGRPDIARAVQQMYEKSLSDLPLSELMTSVLSGKATQEQILQFRAYTKEFQEANARLSQHEVPIPEIAAAQTESVVLNSSSTSGNGQTDEEMNKVENQIINQSQASEQWEDATDSKAKISQSPDPSNMADNHQKEDAYNVAGKVRPFVGSLMLPPQAIRGSKSKSKVTLTASTTKALAGSKRKPNRSDGVPKKKVKLEDTQAGSQDLKIVARAPPKPMHSRVTRSSVLLGLKSLEGEESRIEGSGDRPQGKNGPGPGQASSGGNSMAPPSTATKNPLVNNINALKAKIDTAPNSKTALGRQVLSIVIDGCLRRSSRNGNAAVGQAIKRFYDESLSNPSFADFLDGLFTGKATRQQISHFQTYVKDYLRGAEAKISQPVGSAVIADITESQLEVSPKPASLDEANEAAPSDDHTRAQQPRGKSPQEESDIQETIIVYSRPTLESEPTKSNGNIEDPKTGDATSNAELVPGGTDVPSTRAMSDVPAQALELAKPHHVPRSDVDVPLLTSQIESDSNVTQTFVGAQSLNSTGFAPLESLSVPLELETPGFPGPPHPLPPKLSSHSPGSSKMSPLLPPTDPNLTLTDPGMMGI